MTIIEKAILAKYPDYDFDRYRFRAGDIVQSNDGAVIIVIESSLTDVYAYIYKKSFIHNVHCKTSIPYEELPYFAKGEFKSLPYSLRRSLNWRVGDIVQDPQYGTVCYLYADAGYHQGFYAWVLGPENSYYLHQGIYLQNPYGTYVSPVCSSSRRRRINMRSVKS